ncbi:MAG: hypothetical protein AB8B57_12275 [Congregibacter sp.]
MIEPFVFIHVALPALFGAAIATCIFQSLNLNDLSILAIFLGTGSVLGNLLFALVAYVLSALGLNLFDGSLLLLMDSLAFASTAVLMCVTLRRRKPSSLRRPEISTALVSLPLALLLLAQLFVILGRPMTGWDSIDFWLPTASQLINPDEITANSGETLRHRHPLTAAFIAARDGTVASASEHYAGMLLSWWVCLVSMAVIASGTVAHFSKSGRIGLLAGYATMSAPLLENHGLIAGYAELWIAALLVSSCAFFMLYFRWRSIVFLAIGVGISSIAIFLKNTGVMYSCALVFAFIFISTVTKPLKRFKYIALTSFAFVIGVAYTYEALRSNSFTTFELIDNVLIYNGGSLEATTLAEDSFMIRFYPVDTEALPKKRKRRGYDYRIIDRNEKIKTSESVENLKVNLPKFDVKYVRIGKYSSQSKVLWIQTLSPNSKMTSYLGGLFIRHWGDHKLIEFAGWVVDIESVNSLRQVLKNEIVSLLFNSSFSVFFIGLLFINISMFRSAYAHNAGNQQAVLFASTASLTILVVLMASQIFSSYVFEHSIPGNDQGNSRFSLPWLALTIISLGASLGLSNRDWHPSSH